jgi:Ca2+-binding RTX toxin-like protein
MPAQIPLPFGPGTYSISRGFGVGSHQGFIHYSVDFDVGLDTKVLAQGNGTVVDLEGNVPDSPEPVGSYLPKIDKGSLYYGNVGMGNFVTVRYDDGFYATYQHLQKDSIAVDVGDRVITGRFLGEVGKTGHIEGVHLHVTYGEKPYTAYSGDSKTADDDEIAADGSQTANHNTEPVLFAADPDGKLNPGIGYAGDNFAGNITVGTAGNDTLTGGVGRDQLIGKAGDDELFGGGGNDILTGGPDADPMNVDTLTGGPGNDQFLFSTGSDVIKDFNYQEDALWLPADTTWSFNSWANTTILTYLNGTVALKGVDLGPVAKDYPWLKETPLAAMTQSIDITNAMSTTSGNVGLSTGDENLNLIGVNQDAVSPDWLMIA